MKLSTAQISQWKEQNIYNILCEDRREEIIIKYIVTMRLIWRGLCAMLTKKMWFVEER